MTIFRVQIIYIIILVLLLTSIFVGNIETKQALILTGTSLIILFSLGYPTPNEVITALLALSLMIFSIIKPTEKETDIILYVLTGIVGIQVLFGIAIVSYILAKINRNFIRNRVL